MYERMSLPRLEWARRTLMAAAAVLPLLFVLPVLSSPVGQFECSSSEDCDDGSYCNGAEICDDGACSSGVDPCSDGQVCNEEADFCAGDGPNPGLTPWSPSDWVHSSCFVEQDSSNFEVGPCRAAD